MPRKYKEKKVENNNNNMCGNYSLFQLDQSSLLKLWLNFAKKIIKTCSCHCFDAHNKVDPKDLLYIWLPHRLTSVYEAFSGRNCIFFEKKWLQIKAREISGAW